MDFRGIGSSRCTEEILDHTTSTEATPTSYRSTAAQTSRLIFLTESTFSTYFRKMQKNTWLAHRCSLYDIVKNIDHICQKSFFEHAICSFVPQILQCRCVCVRLRTEHTQADREIQGGSNDNEEKTIHNRASAVHGAHDGTVGGIAQWSSVGRERKGTKQ